MESAQAKVRYVIPTKVVAVEERFKDVYVSGFGDKAVFERRSLGHFAFLRGSYEALHVGYEKPDLKPGDEIKISIEKVEPCPPLTNTNPTTTPSSS